MEQYFPYGDKELAYLKSKDKRLAEAIDKLGVLKRKIIPDLFSALVHSIIGQQISTKAHETIWKRVNASLGEITPKTILSLSTNDLQSLGISLKKVDYIQDAAKKIETGIFDINSLRKLNDEEVCNKLSELNGIGKWTAEMLMLHSLMRPNVLSFGDLGIQRGMRMLYHHRKITKELFRKYQRRYSPYGSVASIYLWAISAGVIAGMKDYVPQKI